ncbi:hypothetical protein [Alishewanella sp. SMS8]|uniref:hypothetical protein n=1 Tax=Alishewanella sp. SMS8 TaxID=2994676 RepID=UPI0027414F3E|nr:hypothetical protein [Alishewanella sp. SMS8]MDP5207824.1 hypothetical protein [Alishewanella sp. SMS9]MDP5460301.1 hypothetical protein [Alishewanella sp. SMS8]
MLWELIATIFAGLGAAGVALGLRFISRQRLPRWLIPVFAAVGMLSFQIHSEYNWYSHQTSLLPEGVAVVKTIEQTAPWRPWSYFFPQTLRFIAADVANAAVNQRNSALVLVDLYFFERRMSAKRVPQVVHCQQMAQADFTENLQIPTAGEALSSQWRSLSATDPLITLLCAK